MVDTIQLPTKGEVAVWAIYDEQVVEGRAYLASDDYYHAYWRTSLGDFGTWGACAPGRTIQEPTIYATAASARTALRGQLIKRALDACTKALALQEEGQG